MFSITTKRTDRSLDQHQIVTAAFAQLEEDGLQGLSMRRLATRLGVQAPALYWHVSDKAALLGFMARELYAAAYERPAAAATWQQWLTQFGHALRDITGARRDGAMLCATARPPVRADPQQDAEVIAEALIHLGLDMTRALAFQSSIISFVIGWGVFKANGPMHDFIGHMVDIDHSFALGLDALVAGFGLQASPDA